MIIDNDPTISLNCFSNVDRNVELDSAVQYDVAH